MHKLFFVLLLGILCFSCKNESQPQKNFSLEEVEMPKLNIESTPQGMDLAEKVTKPSAEKIRASATIDFEIEGIKYRINRNCGLYEFKRTEADGKTVDIIDNQSYTRTVNGKEETLKDWEIFEKIQSLKEELFLMELTFGLASPHIEKTSLGPQLINGKNYEVLDLAYIEENYQAPFLVEAILWVNTDNFEPDYVASRFGENQSKLRFRKITNKREIKGIGFSDYEEYLPKDISNIALEEMAKAYEDGQLKEGSKKMYHAIEVVPGERDCD